MAEEKKDFGQQIQDKMNEMFLYPTLEDTHIKKIIGVVSGKGGVGKSMVTGLSAVTTNRKGLVTAVLDADVTGPSIPKMFGMTERLRAQEEVIRPSETESGIKIVSTNLIMDNPDDPVIWRGPVVSGVIKQFYSETKWQDVDVMFIDMPPGTGDVPLTVFQSLPLDGIIVVTSPQDLVSMIVGKALKMADMMNVPVLGIVENMSYVLCPDCGKKIEVFGPSHINEVSEKYGVPVLAKLPIDPALAPLADSGHIEEYESHVLDAFGDSILDILG